MPAHAKNDEAQDRLARLSRRHSIPMVALGVLSVTLVMVTIHSAKDGDPFSNKNLLLYLASTMTVFLAALKAVFSIPCLDFYRNYGNLMPLYYADDGLDATSFFYVRTDGPKEYMVSINDDRSTESRPSALRKIIVDGDTVIVDPAVYDENSEEYNQSLPSMKDCLRRGWAYNDGLLFLY